MSTNTKAEGLADYLARIYRYWMCFPVLLKAAAELRRLAAVEVELASTKKALALVQQHHTTAWNRGHQAGMRASRDTVKQATDAVKRDAWGNTQLTEALLAAEAERDRLRARLDRAVNAAVEHFGENAIRYKFSLTKSGKVMQEFPRHMDGHWYALQRADDDAHVGLSLRCVEAEAERDRLAAEVEALRLMESQSRELADLLTTQRGELVREIEALRADAELWRSLYRRAINEANGLTNYVDERPELRRAERRLEAIELEARAIDSARKEQG